MCPRSHNFSDRSQELDAGLAAPASTVEVSLQLTCLRFANQGFSSSLFICPVLELSLIWCVHVCVCMCMYVCVCVCSLRRGICGRGPSTSLCCSHLSL